MKESRKKFGILSALVSALCVLPSLASAHEVYVLTPQLVHDLLKLESPNPFTMISSYPDKFAFWVIVGVIVVTTVFAASVSHGLERVLHPFLQRIKKYAAPIARITLGIGLLCSAYNGDLFGPELPLSNFGALGMLFGLVFAVSGSFVIAGYETRLAALSSFLVFIAGIIEYKWYMLTYSNYFGEIALVAILGGGLWSVDAMTREQLPKKVRAFAALIEPYSWLILRVSFGVSLIFAAVYAKFLHAQLALAVVTDYNLTQYFPWEPLFIVLGAGLIEIAAGFMFMLGIEIRHTAAFLLFWLTLSLLYFQESVWPHALLFGILFAFICHGYDKYTVEGRMYKRGRYEPIL